MNRYIKNIIVLAFIALIAVLIWEGGPRGLNVSAPKTIEYSVARKMVADGEVVSGNFTKDQFRYETKKGDKYITNLDRGSPEEIARFQALLSEKNVKWGVEKPLFSDAMWSMILTVILPLGFLVVLWMLFMKQR